MLQSFISGHYRYHKELFRRIRRCIVHDIWIPRRHYSFTEMCKYVTEILLDFLRPDGFWICFAHNGRSPHIHFIHDCAYSNS
ncbi:hypothetical protein O3M35_002461 [Rhynocoris fuscipes]|uniref:Maturase K n=1 Tax=Rhynocoris fuscipes TaxID=488301 RepID=A0AAW1CPI2_9HEMI